MLKPLLLSLAATFAVATGPTASAQTYPTKTVKLIVPFAPGGTTDIIARIVAAKITGELGQSVVVENKAGGGGVIGAAETARATPDGYSLGVATVSTIATAPAIQPKTPYKPLTDFTPIINIAATPNVITVHPSFPAKDYPAFLAELKANPGKHSYASTGYGSITHLLMELFMSISGTEMTHIAYKGAGPALNDVAGGQVPIMLDNLPSSLPFIKSGRLIPLVVAAPERLKELPNVPTFKEVGLDDVNRVAFYGIYGPKNLPQPIVDMLSRTIADALTDAKLKARFADLGGSPLTLSPTEFGKLLRDDTEKWGKVIRAANVLPI